MTNTLDTHLEQVEILKTESANQRKTIMEYNNQGLLPTQIAAYFAMSPKEVRLEISRAKRELASKTL